MGEKKVMSRRVAIALGIVCVSLLALLVGNVYTLSSQIASLSSQISEKNSQIEALNSQIADKDDTISLLNSQIAELQDQIESLKSVQLHEVNIIWDWNEPLIGDYYVHVSGTVFNSGTYMARNVRIDVWLYDSNGVIIKSDTINLGDIAGKTYVNFVKDIYYGRTHCAYHFYAIGQEST